MGGIRKEKTQFIFRFSPSVGVRDGSMVGEEEEPHKTHERVESCCLDVSEGARRICNHDPATC